MQGPWGGNMLDVAKEKRGTSVTATEGFKGRGQGKRELGGQGGYFGVYFG